jgi:glyoxylase-like metal-dependent hydrolase (beta-lactamase superfamily II)
MVQIKVFTFNLFAENTIILCEDITKESAIIDPGVSNKDEEKILEDFISKNELKIKYLINTHCHLDHILGCDFIKRKFNPEFYAPEKDIFLLHNAPQQAEMFSLSIEQPPLPDKIINEQTELYLGKSRLNFLFTPGHTPGEVCIYLKDEKVCITGDVLFKEGIGRTDLWGGDYDTLINSIHLKLLTLPDETKIYPGHGETSTIGDEKINNPFLN